MKSNSVEFMMKLGFALLKAFLVLRLMNKNVMPKEGFYETFFCGCVPVKNHYRIPTAEWIPLRNYWFTK